MLTLFEGRTRRPPYTRVRGFLGGNVVQLNYVAWNLVAHALLAVVGATWFGFTWWPWVIVPSFLCTAALSLRTCLPDRKRSALGRIAQEFGVVYSGALIIAVPLVVLVVVAGVLWSSASEPSTRRALVASAYLVALLVTGWGVVLCRRWVRQTRIVVSSSLVPPQLHGYRIAHLSDLHIGSNDPRHVGERWARLANRLSPDLIVITGDLVTKGSAYYDDVCAIVGQLRAKDGVWICLGNHDLYDADGFERALTRAGAQVLRNRWATLQRGGVHLVIAGLDAFDRSRAGFDHALADRPPDCFTLLLAHYPSTFERVLDKNVQLVLSGHTHGGQIGLPWVGDRINIATLSGQRGRGLFRCGGSQLYVTAGLGTTGVPIRIGVRPELALLCLERPDLAPCRTPDA